MNDIYEKLNDRSFQQKLINDPKTYAKELGYDTDSIEVKVVQNTANTFYMSLNPHVEGSLDLSDIQAAGESGSASSVSSLGSMGCACSTSSTVACAGSAGTVK